MKLWVKIAIALPILLIVAAGYFIFTNSGVGVDAEHPPQFIQADFIDLSKIYSISKFRSGAGHDFSGSGETCRSMKHYFQPNSDPEFDKYFQNGGKSFPIPDPTTATAIYSPVDGRITGVDEEQTPIGKQVGLASDKAPQFLIRLFHLYLLDGFKAGSKVKAGEQIAWINKGQGTDIAIQVGQMPWNEKFISYFSVLPDAVFENYKKRGVTSREELIISKAERDANPLKCNTDQDQRFVYPDGYDQKQDYLHLSGYQTPTDGRTP
ncbi:MAG: hypothetical protein A3F35_03495 [Candidatus Woykebacteria bacterium RIFCSPHIGHO2_12_FULL_45_10]|uniref:Uncharacterized protein n=1 Tax=Candidatus Woykebacteria bacterium RIFCSPHIGHO2_12_FULL_45_10 TaxID=1802603 RepID=A0A1G1WS26_9BACT|nr:MAG: hypothetical protein A3F35_03495 [Candidatus Woykebacteria bacterium RIFCSPHIGHO2_12_FULL_45_10]